MKTTLINAVTNEIKAVYVDGEKIEAEKYPQPIKPEIAEAFETALWNYAELYEQATSRISWRGNMTNLSRFTDTPEAQAENFTEAIADLQNRIELWNKALASLRIAERDREKGAEALYGYKREMGNWHEANRYREMFELDPELYSLHAIAIKKVMREAEQAKKVKWNKLTHYFLDLAVYACVNGVTREEAEEALDGYIEARQMAYTVSTKNLRMRVS